jgi:hypothetical protein
VKKRLSGEAKIRRAEFARARAAAKDRQARYAETVGKDVHEPEVGTVVAFWSCWKWRQKIYLKCKCGVGFWSWKVERRRPLTVMCRDCWARDEREIHASAVASDHRKAVIGQTVVKAMNEKARQKKSPR